MKSVDSTLAISSPAATVEALYRADADRLWRAVFAFCADPEITSDSVAEAYAQLIRRGEAVRDAQAWTWRTAFVLARGALKGRSQAPTPLAHYDAHVDRYGDPDLLAAVGQIAMHRWALFSGAVLMLAACLPTGVQSPATAPLAPTMPPPTAPPPSPTPTAEACPPAEPFAIEDGEQWIVMQSLTTEFGPERCPDDADHDDTIYLVRPDGTGLHRLVPDEWAGSEIRPTWSPDGQRIAFLRARLPSERGELWVINADGTGAELLYTCAGPLAPDSDCNSIEYPDWATDGAIYFGRDSNPLPDGPPATFEIMRHDPATGETTVVLTREDGMSVEQSRLSSDASQAVYVRYRVLDSGEEQAALFVADLATDDERQLLDWGVYAVAYPDWSANDQIAFNTWDLRLFPTTTEAANLYLINADGSDLRPLTDFGSNDTRATQPRWSADGCGLVYTEVRRTADPYGERHPAFMAIAEGDGCDDFELDGSIDVVGTHPELRPLPLSASP